MKTSEFRSLVKRAVSEVPMSEGTQCFVDNYDIELRADLDSWLTIGLRGTGQAVSLTPHFSVAFHEDLWLMNNWSLDDDWVSVLDVYSRDEWLPQVLLALQEVAKYKPRDIQDVVLEFCVVRGWLEAQAYIQLTMGDTRQSKVLLSEVVDRYSNDSNTAAEVGRCRQVLDALRSDGRCAALAVLREWRTVLHSSPHWRRFSVVKGTGTD